MCSSDLSYEGVNHARRFVEVLHANDLIENITMEITLNDGSTNQLQGFAALNEENLQSLKADVLGEMNKAGFLMPMYMMLASMVNVKTLIDRKNLQKEQQASDPLF